MQMTLQQIYTCINKEDLKHTTCKMDFKHTYVNWIIQGKRDLWHISSNIKFAEHENL